MAAVGAELLAARFAQARVLAHTSPRAFAVFTGVFAHGTLGSLEYALAASLAAGAALRATAAVRIRRTSLRARRTTTAAKELVG